MEEIPSFVQEQKRLVTDEAYQAKLKELGEKISPNKRRTVFISHAWNLPVAQDKYNEQWGDDFVNQLATDLSLMGFDVFLDTENAGIGVALNGTMKKGIGETNHVLMVLTNTYFYKVNERPMSGVSIELDYIISRIEKMGGASVAGECRFVLPFLLVPRIPGFPLVEGRGGFAGTYLQNVGYENALVDTWNKLYSQNVPLKPITESPDEFVGYLKAAKEYFVTPTESRREFIFNTAVATGPRGVAKQRLDKNGSGDLAAQMVALMNAGQQGDRVYFNSALARGEQGSAEVKSAELMRNFGMQKSAKNHSDDSDEEDETKKKSPRIEKKSRN